MNRIVEYESISFVHNKTSRCDAARLLFSISLCDVLRQIIAEVGAAKAASLPEAMINDIVNGRIQKFLKENTLLEQEYQLSDDKVSVKAALAAADKEAKVVAFRRFSLSD